MARLEGWEEFLRADPSSAEQTLEEIVAFAIAFEARGEHALGIFTAGVKRQARAAGIREAVPEHVASWKGARLDGYRGGPFADRSGRAIGVRTASR